MTVVNIYSEIIDNMAKTPKTNHDASRSAMPTGDTTTTPTRKQSFDPCAGAVDGLSRRSGWNKPYRPISRPITFVSLVWIFRVSYVHLPLGRYIDGGKSSSSGQDTELRRSEMVGSYPCWLLYADQMMKIGFECNKWSKGICNN